MTISSPQTLHKYVAPTFTRHFRNSGIPTHKLHLANLPTPIHKIPAGRKISVNDETKIDSVLQPLWDLNITLFIKRDDMSGGVEVGGNKIRKLEFLLADALRGDYDSVVTIGGEQSNHCRATAAACRMVGLEPHLILRTKRANIVEKDKEEHNQDTFGYTGNILFDRMVGAQIHTCTPGEYGRFGNKALVERMCNDIESKSISTGQKKKKVYPIPVGGSNGLGSWGYIDGVSELIHQLNGEEVDHVVFACGSGGTATGITLGLGLAYHEMNSKCPRIHAVGVCDDPDYFYSEIEIIGNEMGFDVSSLSTKVSNTQEYVKGFVTVHQGKGLGYASSTKEELEFIAKFALETGIVLDPGKFLCNIYCTTSSTFIILLV